MAIRDLTKGEPRRVLTAFCLPLFGSIVFQQLYNIADSFVAGKFIGENALAAVGDSYEVTLIFIAFAFGCNIGCSVMTSRLFGSRLPARMKTAVSTALIGSACVCLVLVGAGLALCERALRLIQTPEELMADAVLYLRIYICGFPFLLFYNISNGIFSALGDSRTPFRFLAASSTANIALDILFVTVFHMGVAGVAWATFLCQGVSCILSLGAMFRMLGKIKTEEKPRLFSFTLFRQIARIAVPSIFQQSFVSVGNIVIQSVINGFGPGVIAGYAAAIKLNNLVITSLTTLAGGVSSFTAQNIGAGFPARVKAGFREGVRLILTFAIPLGLLYFLAGRSLLELIIENPTETALSSGGMFLKIVPPLYWLVSFKLVSDAVLQGGGRTREFVTDTVLDLFLRAGLAIVFSRTALGSTGIWCAWPVGWLIGTLLALWFCKSFIRRLENGQF